MKKNVLVILCLLSAILTSCKKEDVKPQVITNTTTVTVIEKDTIYCTNRKDILYGIWKLYGSQTGEGVISVSPSEITVTATPTTLTIGSNQNQVVYSNDYSIINYSDNSNNGYKLSVYNCNQLKLTQLYTNDQSTAQSYYLKREY
ncbi:MAG: hypothetical protein H7282_05010 [Cytophagaceae bacterium]|nr:hypothetical protein [Cytophagaceae bacterium]